MTLPECYAALGGDWADVLGRLRSEALIARLLLKFPEDRSFALLQTAAAAHDREAAFRAAHTLKGVCQDLSFTALGASASALTEALRHQWTPQVEFLLPQVEKDHAVTLAAISAFRSQDGQ